MQNHEGSVYKLMKKPYMTGSNSCEDYEWEDLCEDLTELMSTYKPTGLWNGTVSGFGWRGVDGEGTIKATNGRELLLGVLPNTECSFKVYKERGGIMIDNAHHDKPCGGEIYRLKVAR